MFLVITHLPSLQEIGTYKFAWKGIALDMARHHAEYGLHTVVFDITAGKQIFESKPVDSAKAI